MQYNLSASSPTGKTQRTHLCWRPLYCLNYFRFVRSCLVIPNLSAVLYGRLSDSFLIHTVLIIYNTDYIQPFFPKVFTHAFSALSTTFSRATLHLDNVYLVVLYEPVKQNGGHHAHPQG